MSENSITVVGNLTRDPEIKYTANGTARTTFGVAVNRKWTNHRTNETTESVSFFNVVCWDTVAQNVADSLTKGQRAVVVGRVEQSNWETEAGERRSTVEIVAQDVGPSLRRASVEIARNPRSNDESASASSSRQRSASQQRGAAEPYF